MKARPVSPRAPETVQQVGPRSVDRQKVRDEKRLELERVADGLSRCPADSEQVVTRLNQQLREIDQESANDDVHSSVFKLDRSNTTVEEAAGKALQHIPLRTVGVDLEQVDGVHTHS